jgi:phosphocarrier protein HPr
MQQTKIIIHDEVGLHARPAAVFVKTAKQFTSKVTVACNAKTADAKSLIRLLALSITKDTEIEITAEGDDEQDAIAALTNLITNNFAIK